MSISKETSSASTKAHWSQTREAGTAAAMRLVFTIYRLCGRRVFSLLMYPVAMYFALFRSEQRNASLKYLLKHYRYHPDGWQSRPGFRHVLLHFKSFAEVILDKMLGWLDDLSADDFVLASPEATEALLNDARGQLIVGSHFGNLEFCRGFMQRYRSKVINILVYDKHAGNFVKLMQNENGASRLNVFQVDEFDVTTIMMLKDKVDAGEWVFIAGDRVPLSGLDRTVNVRFLGEEAPLPIGPYMLAKALECPVKLMFAYRSEAEGNKVLFDVAELCEKLQINRKTRQQDIQNYAQQFASKLEAHCLNAPYQWFNFYDFWQPGSIASAGPANKQDRQ